jgi:lipid-binding SYLF domain-containing protein
MNTTRSITAAAITAATLLTAAASTGCSAGQKSDAEISDLRSDAATTINRFKRTDPGMSEWFADSYGYAVFPTVGKGAVGVGGAYGEGLVYEQGNPIGNATLTQATVGFQLGGQSYSEVIFFETKDDLDDFTTGNFEFSAQVSAVALQAGVSADADYQNGVAVFTATKDGLMYEASVGGQKFSFRRFN